ncbi:MAG: hypothetical protein KC421_04560 [Anaerolineales bacterium]|nr:hypothetical protein [Anaerolineales bacterium]
MMKKLVGFCFVFLLTLAACQPSPSLQQTSIAQERSTSTSQPTLVVVRSTSTPTPVTPTMTPTVVKTETAVPTVTPTIQPTSTPSPTRTATPVITPLITPTLAPLPPLTVRNPSLEQLQEYLLNIPAAYFNRGYGYPRPPEYEVEILHFQGFTEVATVIYEDINGDGQEDMIFHDEGLLSIWLWQDQDYSQPFLLIKSNRDYLASSRFRVEDWTNDQIPEIVWLTRSGGRYGTGVEATGWSSNVVHCGQKTCGLVWSQEMIGLASNFNDGGIRLFRGGLVKSINDQGQVTLSFSEGELEFYADDVMYHEPLVIYPTTVTTFVWTGTEFEELSVETFGELQLINEEKSLEAISADGVKAEISAYSNHWADAGNDVCQLIVNRQLLGQPFGCKENFTKVTWQDITHDGQPEIVVTALSGSNPRDEDYNVISEIDCVHERFLAYQWWNGGATEIANVAGCIVQTDLYGVRLEDLDNDGQVEIILAYRLTSESECHGEYYPIYCWSEPTPIDHVYKWNGTAFVFWGELEGE